MLSAKYVFPVILSACAVVGFLAWPASVENVPELFADLPSGAAETEQAFDSRVAERYVLPMPTDLFIDLLEKDGFGVDAENEEASFIVGGMVCERIWRVLWETVDAQVTSVEARFGTVCP